MWKTEAQSKALDKSVNKAPNEFPLSLLDFHFSIIVMSQCWGLKPFLNHIGWSKHKDIWSNEGLSNNLIIG